MQSYSVAISACCEVGGRGGGEIVYPILILQEI